MPNQNAINASTPNSVSNGGSGLSSQTPYAILTGGTTNTGNFQNLSSVGNLGQSIKSNGINALPSMTGAGWVLIQTQTANNSVSLEFTTGFSSTYGVYMIVVTGLIPVTNLRNLYAQISTDGGATYIGSNYQSGVLFSTFSNIATYSSNTSSTSLLLSNQIANTGGNAGGVNGIYYYSYFGQNLNQANSGLFVTHTAGRGLSCGGYYPVGNVALANAIKFFMSSGNIATGTISIYGLSK